MYLIKIVLIFFIFFLNFNTCFANDNISNSEKIANTTVLIKEYKEKNADKKVISALYWLRGGLLEQEENYTRALSDYNNSLQYYPDYIVALKSLEYLKIKLKDYDGALIEANKIIKLESNNYNNFMDRAGIYGRVGEYQKAINDYTKSIVLKPKNPEAFEMRGMLEILINQNDKGYQDLKFAKQQYYDLKMYEKYQELSVFINDIYNKKQITNTIKDTQNTIIINNSSTEQQLKNIDESIKDLNRTLYTMPIESPIFTGW